MDEQEKEWLRFAPPEAQRLCTPCRSTWWRWRAGKTRAPVAVLNLLRLLVGGELPHAGPAWSGWKFKNGQLYDPAGTGHTPTTILSWWWTAQRLQAQRADENRFTQAMPANVVILDLARPAHRITAELNRRISP